jgi:TonB family protein
MKSAFTAPLHFGNQIFLKQTHANSPSSDNQEVRLDRGLGGPMSRERWVNVPCRFWQTAAELCLAATVAIALALPVRAADSREIRSRVAPTYPEIARRLKIAGAIRVEATVDPDGKVIDAKTISGNRLLSLAAEDAVRKWRFEPATAQSTVEVTVNFAIGN